MKNTNTETKNVNATFNDNIDYDKFAESFVHAMFDKKGSEDVTPVEKEVIPSEIIDEGMKVMETLKAKEIADKEIGDKISAASEQLVRQAKELLSYHPCGVELDTITRRVNKTDQCDQIVNSIVGDNSNVIEGNFTTVENTLGNIEGALHNALSSH